MPIVGDYIKFPPEAVAALAQQIAASPGCALAFRSANHEALNVLMKEACQHLNAKFVMTVLPADGSDPGDINQATGCPGSPGC